MRFDHNDHSCAEARVEGVGLTVLFLTETITEPPDSDTDSTESIGTVNLPSASTVDSDAIPASTTPQLVLPVVLSCFSVIVLTLIGVAVIIANIWRARRKKKTATNPLEALT